MTYYDLKTVKSELVQAVLDSIQEKTKMTEKVFHQLLVQYEVIDLLNNLPLHKCSVSTFLSHLRPLQPRHYSIASSPQKSHDQVSLCIAVVRYTLNGTARTGVCTTYIQDRLSIGSRVPVFISQNPEFRLPLDPQTPIIMIGPGTGIAPFRAFLQERTIATNGTNNNTLYFGCRHKNKDYLYQNELEHCAINGYLLLRTAFSRDQLNKVYVQNLLWEDKEMIWKLLQVGAYVYVCGDAKYMARDVNQTLINIISTHNDDPHMYMKHLESEGRYQRDVWVV